MNSLPGNVLLIAGSEEDVPTVFQYIRDAGIMTESNPDLYVRHYRQFGIDDAQELRARASTRAIGDRRVFIVSAGGMTSEAQNALLKTLEEPPDDALFVFIVPAPDARLSTVRSRSQRVEIDRTKAGRTATGLSAAEFLAATPTRRLEMLKIVLEKDADDKYDTGAILAFLAELERHVARRSTVMDLRNRTSAKETLGAIYRTRSYATDRGALVKTLLESVALLAPMV
jgi:DNA polymerase III delta prime subunit